MAEFLALDLATVSVATNTVIELARGIEADVYPICKHFDTKISSHESYFIGNCKAYGIDALSESSGTDDDCKSYGIANALFMNSHNSIMIFFGNYSPEDNADYDGKYGPFDEQARSLPITNEEKYLRDKSTLQETLGCCKIYTYTITIRKS